MADNSMDPADPDAALMVAFQKGDSAAFEQLLGKYHRVIVNFIYKIVNNASEAEDLTQDVFLKIFRAREHYEPRAPFAAWLYRIAVNVSLKAVAKKRFPLFGFRLNNDRDGNFGRGGTRGGSTAQRRALAGRIGNCQNCPRGGSVAAPE